MRRGQSRVLRLCALAAFAALAARRSPSLQAPPCAVPLLGGSVPWQLNAWRQETDGVRGGASTVSLKADTDIGVELSGSLDASKLGAAFAGVVLQETKLPKPLSEFRGLVLDVARCDGKEYSVTLKMRGAMMGQTHKFQFTPESPGKVEMPFKEFVPIFRGKPAPQPAPPLDPARVDMVILQTTSDFGKQEGPFSLTIKTLEGLEGQMEKVNNEPPARTTRWECPACQTMNFKGAESCQRCGSPKVIVKGEAAKPQKWECAGCGTNNFPGASECFKCGAPRG